MRTYGILFHHIPATVYTFIRANAARRCRLTSLSLSLLHPVTSALPHHVFRVEFHGIACFRPEVPVLEQGQGVRSAEAVVFDQLQFRMSDNVSHVL